MALTYSVETGTGTSQVYDIRWESELGYLNKDNVYVYTGDDYTLNNITFTWVNDTQIQLSSAVDFVIRRVVPRNVAINDYTDGAILRSKNLDASFAQGLMIQEEVTDGYLTPSGTMVFNQDLDMQDHNIRNLAASELSTDAVNRGEMDDDNAEQDAYTNEQNSLQDADRLSRDSAQTTWNNEQDTRLNDIEGSVAPGDLRYRRVTLTATEGQTEFYPTVSFTAIHLLFINGIHQIAGESYEKIGSVGVRLSTSLHDGDRVVAIIGAEPEFTPTEQVDFNYINYPMYMMGGETVVNIPITFKQIAAVYINGVHQNEGSAFEYNLIAQTATFAEPLKGGDEVVFVLGDVGEFLSVTLSNIVAVARALNVKEEQVAEVGSLDGVLYIYDATTQTTWIVPTLNGTGETITSISGSELITSGGTYTLIPLMVNVVSIQQTDVDITVPTFVVDSLTHITTVILLTIDGVTQCKSVYTRTLQEFTFTEELQIGTVVSILHT